jgi:hypothetical protein
MKYINYVVGAFAAVSLFGCSNFLDEVPDQRTIVDTPAKAKSLLVYAYPSASAWTMMELMSDNADDSGRTENTSVQGREFYLWQDETGESTDSPAEFWESSYKAIAQANAAIEAIESMEATKSERDAILGEAFLARAYNHWMLSVLFCEVYEPGTADSKMGLPYLKDVEKELIREYERGTLAELYDNIEEDIKEGLLLVTDNYDKKGFHFTKDAGKAFAARFYAAKGDWNAVMEVTNNLGNFPANKLRDYSEMMNLDSDRRGQLYGSGDNQANLLVSGVLTVMDRTSLRDRFGATRNVLLPLINNAYNPFNRNYVYGTLATGYRGYDIFSVPKFYEYFVYTNQSAGIGYPFVNIPLLTNDETYLYRIEATIMAGDYETAAQMMGFFAKYSTVGFEANNESTVTSQAILRKINDASEYQPYYEMDDTQRKMTKFLAKMRQMAFIHQGNRWFDIKRYNLPVEHKLVGGEIEVLESKDLRKAVQLPRTAISFNLTPNPR